MAQITDTYMRHHSASMSYEFLFLYLLMRGLSFVYFYSKFCVVLLWPLNHKKKHYPKKSSHFFNLIPEVLRNEYFWSSKYFLCYVFILLKVFEYQLPLSL